MSTIGSQRPEEPAARIARADETPAQRAARQLEDLMRRNHVKNAAELERMLRRSGGQVVSQVTVRRILKAEATTEPEKGTLRRLAEFFKETYEQAFPEPGRETAASIEVGGQRLLITTPDGRPVSPSLLARLTRAASAIDSDPSK